MGCSSSPVCFSRAEKSSWLVGLILSYILYDNVHVGGDVSISTLLIGYYYGLLLRDLDVEETVEIMRSNDSLALQDQALVFSGYSGHQRKIILLEIIRQKDLKYVSAFCELLIDFDLEIGSVLLKGT